MYGLISTTHVAVSTILLQSNDFCYEVTFDDTFSITPTPTFYVADTEITYEDGYYQDGGTSATPIGTAISSAEVGNFVCEVVPATWVCFFTLNWIPTRHKRSGQDATHGWPLRKSEIVVFHILVCTRCMCLQHCTVMARVTPALESNSHRVCPA